MRVEYCIGATGDDKKIGYMNIWWGLYLSGKEIQMNMSWDGPYILKYKQKSLYLQHDTRRICLNR